MDIYELVKQELEKKLGRNLSGYLEIPKPEFGDYSLTLAFELARQEGISPIEAAQRIVEKLKEIPFVARVEVVNGYVNLFFDWPEISKKMLAKKLSLPNIGQGERIIIEHTSVNPNKALHIGHLRNACLGDSLARLLRLVGYDVKVLNYIDDTGLQIGYHLLGFKELGYSFDVNKKFDIYASEIYPEIMNKVEKDEALKEKARDIIRKLEEGDEEITELAEKFVEKVLKAQLETLWRFNIFYDLLNFESHIIRFNLWSETFEKLKQKNLIKLVEEGKLAGCWIISFDDPHFKSLKESEKVLVRSDGTLVYTAKDISYAMWKHGLLRSNFRFKEFVKQPNGQLLWKTDLKGVEKSEFNNVKRSINVIDVRQSYVQDIVRKTLEKFDEKISYVHYAYEVVALSKGTASLLGIETDSDFLHMSGRKGIFVNVDDVYEALEKKAYEEVRKRNPDIDEEKVKEIARKIAVSTLRFELTKVDRRKLIVFDMVESLKLEGNTAPYLMYSYVRAKSVLKKASKQERNFSINHLNEEEVALLREIARLPVIIRKSVELLDLSIVANYLVELSFKFNLFYEKHRILGTPEEAFRLTLLEKLVEVMETGFQILGIEPVEMM